jgi:hypothetical protein
LPDGTSAEPRRLNPQEAYGRKMEYRLESGRDVLVENKPENMTGVLAVPMPEERRRRELALARLLLIAIGRLLSGERLGLETARDLVREIKHTYPELLDEWNNL